MSRQRIFINISDVASFIGQNKWDFITPFERLWKKCDSAGYKSIINQMNCKVSQMNVQLSDLHAQKEKLQNDLQINKISKREYSTLSEQLSTKILTVNDSLAKTVDRIDDIDLTQKEKIQKKVGQQAIDIVNDNTIETNSKKQKLNEMLDQNAELDAQTKKALQKHATSFVNKTHGTVKEDSALQMFQTKYNVTLDVSQQFNKRELEFADTTFEWFVCGKVDGLFVHPTEPLQSFIVEVKNRTKSFFSTLRDYEKSQIQMYMWTLGLFKSKLVEVCNGKIRVTDVERDQQYIDDILQYLQIFIKKFENDFLTNETMKFDYVTFNEEEKRVFIKKLFFADITSAINAKIEQNYEGQDCMIDD